MKFTKEDACKDLMSKIPSTGETLQLSERSINAQVETLLPLLANDDTELADFVSQVLPIFKTADANIRGDVSAQVRAYKESNPIKEVKKTVEEKKEDDPNAALLKRIEELEKRNAMNEKKATLAKRRNEVTSKLNEKGCKDNEWIEGFLSEINFDGEDFDAEARAEKYIKLYNKSEAKAPKDVTPKNPKGSGGDTYLNEILKKAGEKNKSLNGNWGQE